MIKVVNCMEDMILVVLLLCVCNQPAEVLGRALY